MLVILIAIGMLRRRQGRHVHSQTKTLHRTVRYLAAVDAGAGKRSVMTGRVK